MFVRDVYGSAVNLTNKDVVMQGCVRPFSGGTYYEFEVQAKGQSFGTYDGMTFDSPTFVLWRGTHEECDRFIDELFKALGVPVWDMSNVCTSTETEYKPEPEDPSHAAHLDDLPY